jgi:hypothetical protein
MDEVIQTDINPGNQVNVNNGAKRTGPGVVDSIRKHALPWFDEFTPAGCPPVKA